MMLGAIMVPHPPLILPEVGRGRESEISETSAAYDRAAKFLADLGPDTVVVSSPHSAMYTDYFHISPGEHAEGSMADFGAPEASVSVDYDTEMVELISRYASEEGLPAGTLGEKDSGLDHGTIIPLRFLGKYLTDYRLVRIGLSGLSLADHYRLGMLVQKVSDELGRKTAFIGSGDLSHKLKDYGPYGFAKEGPQYDERIMDVMGRAAFEELFDFKESFLDRAAECGHRSFVIMAGALDGLAVEAEKLSHQDVTGVGYGVCTYRVTGKDPGRRFLESWAKKQDDRISKLKEDEDPYVSLARSAVEAYVRHGIRISVPEGLPKEMMSRRAGTFVSLHREGVLRGCIGTISAVRTNIAEEIISNAISAASRDPRFYPVREEELKDLEISVDVLGPSEKINSESELDPSKYGVIVSKGARRGLLLPDLDGVDTVEEQVRIAKRKAGIPEWEKGCTLERFEVVRHT
ncbi:MAG: AmmeMemoRadiSam system protein A [Oscillospiraceae bacterium]|jgi:AmmeMemoRadiSam system protein A